MTAAIYRNRLDHPRPTEQAPAENARCDQHTDDDQLDPE